MGQAARSIGYGIVFVCFIMYMMSRVEPVRSTGGAYPQTEHAGVDVNTNGVTGVSRPANTPAAGYTVNTADFPAGTCTHCHDQHSSYNGATHAQQDLLLFTTNNNTLCGNASCHFNALTTGGSLQYPSWQGITTFNLSSHGTSANVKWPGTNPAAKLTANLCVNCHDPHGSTFVAASEFATGQRVFSNKNAMPSMLFRLEENLCLTCHDGSPASAAKNINAVLARGANAGGTGVYYNHPINRNAAANDRTPSVHSSTETLPLGGANTATHVECTDCHNPHYATAGTHTAPTNKLSNVLLGTWGVSVAAWPNTQAKGSGTLQSAPAFTPVQLTNTATQFEWQLCLRCHSSYSTLPTFAAPNNLTDVSREINPNNNVYHPVAGPGANVSANANFRNSFKAPYAYNSVIYCSDCHESNLDSTNGMPGAVDPQGPHGSANKWIIGNYCDTGAGAVCTTPEQTVICFKCHRFDVYYNNTVALSRFIHPSNAAMRVNTDNVWGIWCMNCHGGNIEGGIHGSNQGKGTSGTANMSDHFMNGAHLVGMTYGTAGSASGSCWTFNGTATYGTVSCSTHKGGKAFTPQYDY